MAPADPQNGEVWGDIDLPAFNSSETLHSINLTYQSSLELL